MAMGAEKSPYVSTAPHRACGRVSSRASTMKNICSIVWRRPLGTFPNCAYDILRINMDILRKLVCQKKTVFRKVWAKHSKSAISYAKGRIYFDNFRCCFNSIPAEPQYMYEMPKCPKSEKIEDALLCESPVGENLALPSDYTPSLIAITGDNQLLRLSADSGNIIDKVYLGSYRKFRYITWDSPHETLVLKSVQMKARTESQEVTVLRQTKKLTKSTIPRSQKANFIQSGCQRSVLFYLAVFSVFPFSLVGVLAIDKDIFGSSVTDAIISHGMLIVMHSAGLVRLYNFEKITEQYMQQKLVIGQTCTWKGETGTIGDFPFGIPCNITLAESPPLLFEVSCLDNAFQVGGCPWHYIITPNRKKDRGVYHIRSLDDHRLAKNGVREMNCCSLEPDWIHFHPDASERIIHVGPDRISVLRLKELQNDAHQHQVTEEFTILANREREVNNRVTVTASGRLVKRRFNLLDDDPEKETFKMVVYEDELDLLTVVAVTQTEAEGIAHVNMHCNATGKLLKKIKLVESWDVTHSHAVFVDRDTLIHLEERPNRNFSCYVYKMLYNSEE